MITLFHHNIISSQLHFIPTHRDLRIQLDIKDLMGVLWACTRAKVSTETDFDIV